jgi:hypothetical protein
MTQRNLILLSVISLRLFAQTKVDYGTQIKNGPGLFPDSSPVYATIYAACAAAVTAGQTLAVTKQWAITTSSTCNANLEFFGGRLIPATGVTVTLGASVDCDPTVQCFNTTAANSAVVFTTPPVISPAWWGSGAAAWNSAFAAAVVGGRGGTVQIPCGTYSLASTVTIPVSRGFRLVGPGACANITWTGNAAVPMFYARSTQLLGVEHLVLNFAGANTALAAFEVDTVTGQQISTQSHFTDIIIEGGGNGTSGSGALSYGFIYGGTFAVTAFNANNDFGLFDNVRIYGAISSGWWIRGGNSVGHQMRQSACGQTQYCVITDLAADGSGGTAVGSFSWLGGTTSTYVQSFWLKGYTGYPVHLQDGISEDCGLLVVQTGGLVGEVNITGWTFTQVGCPITSPIVIDVQGSSLNIQDSLFLSNNLSAGQNVQFRYRHTGGPNNQAQVSIINTVTRGDYKNLKTLMASTSDPNPATYVRFQNWSWNATNGLSVGWVSNMESYQPDGHVVYPEVYGATGDGTTDDCANSYMQTALLRGAATGFPVVFGPYTYLCNTESDVGVLLDVFLNAGGKTFTMTGAGANATYLKTTAAGKRMLHIANNGGVPVRFNISGMSFLGPDDNPFGGGCTSTAGGDGVVIQASGTNPIGRMSDVGVYGFCGPGKVGLLLDGMEDGTFDNLTLVANDTGLKLSGASNANTFNSLGIAANNTYGAYMTDVGSNTFNAMVVQSNFKTGILLNGVVGNTFNSLHLENNNTSGTPNTYGLDMSPTAGGGVLGNIFNSMTQGNAGDRIRFLGAAGNVVANNVFLGGYNATVPAPILVITGPYEAGNFFLSAGNIGPKNITGNNGADSFCGGYQIGCIFSDNISPSFGPGFSTGTASNSDLAGTLVIGGGGSIARNLSGIFTTAPVCTASDSTAASPVQVGVTTTVLTVTGTAGHSVNYICIGRN